MYFDQEVARQYHVDRQRELSETMQNVRYDNAQMAAQIGTLMEKTGRWLADAGRQMRPESREPALVLVPITRHRAHR